MIPLVVAWAAVLKDFTAATVMEEVVIVAAGAVEIVFIIAERPAGEACSTEVDVALGKWRL
jgi:hypothetical protein